MARIEKVRAWRTGLALPNRGLEPTGRSFVTLTIKTEAGERLYPFAVEEARALAEELDALCREVEAQAN